MTLVVETVIMGVSRQFHRAAGTLHHCLLSSYNHYTYIHYTFLFSPQNLIALLCIKVNINLMHKTSQFSSAQKFIAYFICTRS